jgi:Stage II sporulation protein E (SpoIIE)
MRASRLILACIVLSIFLGPVARNTHAQRQVVLGNSTTVLSGLWKFHPGDDLEWARSDFDDTAWGTMDVTPPPGTYDPFYGTNGFVPGWTARGYPGYSGFAWYRLHVNVQNNIAGSSNEATGLAIKMPDNFDDSYQLFVNGQMVGQFGQFTPNGVVQYISLPRAFRLPANVRSGPVTIAVRMWMATFTPLIDPDAGGLHAPPVLGHAPAIDALLQLDWDATNRSLYGDFVELAIVLLALQLAFALFWLDRAEPAYLWLGLTCIAILCLVILALLSNYTVLLSGTLLFLLRDAVLTPIHIGLWVLFWAYWFRLDHMGRLHRAVWSLVLLLGVSIAMLRAPFYGRVVPVHAMVWLSPLGLALKLLLGALLLWVTYRGILKNKAEGWLAIPAVVLVAISVYQVELLVLHVPVTFFPFGLAVSISQIAAMLSLGIITILLIRRFLRSQREREQWKLEMEQARQVQSLLIPSTTPVTPGFAVESVYLPASSVGGDFFQIRPADDGSLLIVVGDVSGKGLKAAMTVSAIVGGLRGCTLKSPAEMLVYLNQILYGQVGGFVTCCAAVISRDGKLTLANAGHPSPYRNGDELPTVGGLPLGIVADCNYDETTYQLAPGDRLTFVSDGVVEATNEKRELFGFARTQQISNQSATTIAETAQKFGQEDDITVVTIIRAPVLEQVAASA